MTDALERLREEYKAAAARYAASGEEIRGLESQILAVRERMHTERTAMRAAYRSLWSQFLGWTGNLPNEEGDL